MTKEVIVDGHGWKPEEHMADRHIFFKEFIAAKRCIKRILTEYTPEKGSFEIVLGIDNTAVAHVLRSFYTSPEFIASDLKCLCVELKKEKRYTHCGKFAVRRQCC